jgi:hypothetical protein
MSSRTIASGETYTGIISHRGDVDKYKVYFKKHGKVNFCVRPEKRDLNISLTLRADDDYNNPRTISLGEGRPQCITLDVDANQPYYIEIKQVGKWHSKSKYHINTIMVDPDDEYMIQEIYVQNIFDAVKQYFELLDITKSEIYPGTLEEWEAFSVSTGAVLAPVVAEFNYIVDFAGKRIGEISLLSSVLDNMGKFFSSDSIKSKIAGAYEFILIEMYKNWAYEAKIKIRYKKEKIRTCFHRGPEPFIRIDSVKIIEL